MRFQAASEEPPIGRAQLGAAEVSREPDNLVGGSGCLLDGQVSGAGRVRRLYTITYAGLYELAAERRALVELAREVLPISDLAADLSTEGTGSP